MYNDVVIFERKIANEYGLVEAIILYEISQNLRSDEVNKTQIELDGYIYTRFHANDFLQFIQKKVFDKAMKNLENMNIIKILKNKEILLVAIQDDADV